jgi:pimeloyl-ACP methyl ester carboxylesterase
VTEAATAAATAAAVTDEGFEQRAGRGFDGTPLRYWIRRREPRWLLTCTGYGGTYPAWAPLFEKLDPAWSILLWDYRGQFGSEAPLGRLPIQISDHSRDLESLLEAESIEAGVLMGWSVGVQVALEHYRRRPEQARALVLINGAYERVLHAPFGDGAGARCTRGLTRAMAHVADRFQPALRPVFRHPRLARLAGALGVVRGNVEAFGPAVAAWQDLDLRRYLEMTLWADEHLTSDMHESVEVPTLITAGERDVITPPRVARLLHERIARSELLLIPDSTHYAIIERPGFCAQSIDRFLRQALRF